MRKTPFPRHFRTVAHLLTFNCYGTHLRGAENGSVDRSRAARGGFIEPSAPLVDYATHLMTDAVATLTLHQSFLVLGAIQQTCEHRKWILLAAHLRTTHVHLVVDGITDTNSAIRDFKAHSSRTLNIKDTRPRWARGANVRPLPRSKAIRAAPAAGPTHRSAPHGPTRHSVSTGPLPNGQYRCLAPCVSLGLQGS